MKKIIILVLVAIAIQHIAIAQTTPAKISFEAAMLKNIAATDTATTASTFVSLANNFERIANAEKGAWQPFYYAAYCYVAMAFQSPDKSAIAALADKAEAFLHHAEALEKHNAEITTLAAMITSCRIMVDPVSRFPTKGKEVADLLAKAKSEDPANPRIYLLQARMQLRTPEAFGGGKAIAKQSAETAIEKFRAFQPANRIAPVWGEAQAVSLLARINTQ